MLEAADYKESNEEDYRRMMADEEVMMTMIFLTAPPPPFSTKMKKMQWSKPDLLFHEILHLKAPLVGSLAFFHLGTEQRGASKKSHPIYLQLVLPPSI